MSIRSDDNFLTRQYITNLLSEQIFNEDNRVLTVNFDNSMSHDEINKQTERALKELDDLKQEKETDHTTTIIYLGEKWENRSGMYQAANEFGKLRTVKMAGSLGFSNGDCRVMSELSEEKMEKIVEANEYFENFFQEHPEGSFEITTRDLLGKEHKLDLNYNTLKAPFELDLGKFDGVHESSLGKYKHFKYVNIPGGEKFGTPYPFNQTNGQFVAEGIVFTVKEGLVIDLKFFEDRALTSYDLAQRKLIKKIFIDKSSLPLSELGLGFYALAGIETYTDSSILSREKSGPHIGMGNTAAGGSKEEEEITKLAGVFQHADFVLDNNPVIMWVDPQTGERRQFYPPLKNKT